MAARAYSMEEEVWECVVCWEDITVDEPETEVCVRAGWCELL